MLKLLFKILLILILLILLLIGGVVAFVKIKGEKALLEGSIARFTPYEIMLPEDTKLRLFPQPKLTASSLALREKTAISGTTDMFTAEEVTLNLFITPTWNKAKLVRLENVQLTNPRVALPTLQATAAALEIRKAHVGQLLVAQDSFFIPVAYARIDDGDVTLQNADGTTQNIKSINLLARGESADAVTATLKATYDGLPLSAQGQFDVRNIGNIASSLTAKTAGITVKAEGDIRTQNQFMGTLSASSANLAKSLSGLPFLALDLGDVNLAQPLAFNTTLNARADRVHAKTFSANLGESVAAAGNLTYTPTSLEGAVNFSALNLDTLNLCGTTQGVGETAQSSASGATEGPWSTEPLPLIGIPLPRVDLALNIAGFACKDVPMTAAKATLQQRNDQFSLDGLALTIGNGTLTGNLFASSATEELTLNANLANIEVMDFVAANTDFLKKLSVPLNGSVSLKTHGTTLAQAISSLDGTLALKATAGNFPGNQAASLALDVANLLQGAGNAVSGKQGNKIENLTLNASIAQGVVSCETCQLRASGGRISLTGEGTIDLPNYAYNLKLIPEAKTTSLFKAPMRLTGPLNKPKVMPILATTQNLTTGIGTALGGPAGAAVGAVLGNVIEKRFGNRGAGAVSGTEVSTTEPQQGFIDGKVEEEMNSAQQKVNEEIQRGVTRGLNKLFGQ